MAIVTGLVEASSDKFNKFSVLVNGTWFSSKYPIPCVTGDTIEFDSGPTGKYCQKAKVLTAGSAAPAANSTGKSAAPTNAARDRSIIRQNSLTHACRIVLDNGIAVTELITTDELAEEVIRIARMFEAYSSGDEDVPVGPQFETDKEFVD